MITTIHPSYHPYLHKPGGLWRWRNDNRSVSAHSLREMSAKLGPDYEIEGWWPNGFKTSPLARVGQGHINTRYLATAHTAYIVFSILRRQRGRR